MTSEKLNQAIALIKAGNKKAALPILKEVIQANPQDENAWLWLYSCVDKVEQKKFCLQKALEINPDNLQVHNALRKLTNLPSQLVQQDAPVKATQLQPVSKNKPGTNGDRRRWFFALGIAGLILFLCIIIALYLAQTGQISALAVSLPLFPSSTMTPSLTSNATATVIPSLSPTVTETVTPSPTITPSLTSTATATVTPTVLAIPLSAPLPNCAPQNDIPAAECDALMALYNSTNGVSWKYNTGWLKTRWPCDWYGVFCLDGHVKILQLGSNNLSGSIPTQLDSLTNLTELSLGNNQLTGSIPAQLGSLTNLTFLSVDNNHLTGPVPAQLGNLTNLTELELGNNMLTGSIPLQLGSLTNLTTLGLNSNQLTGSIPAELGNLTNLTRLSLSGNQLSGSIPRQLGSLMQLQILTLDNNQLTGSIPTELGNLKQLQALFLGDTQLTGEIPASFVNLVNLSYLTLSCGLTSYNPAVISFIDGILGPGWDVACPTATLTPTQRPTQTPT